MLPVRAAVPPGQQEHRDHHGGSEVLGPRVLSRIV
jgi:hypothetical protein